MSGADSLTQSLQAMESADWQHDAKQPVVGGMTFAGAAAPQYAARKDLKADTPGAHRETCGKCGGTGRYGAMSRFGNQCFECKGQGFRLFRQDRATRQANRQKTALRKVRDAAQTVNAWGEAHPAELRWVNEASARGFGFATAMVEALGKYGSLTDGQSAAVQRCMARDTARKVEVTQRVEAAPECNAQRLADSMNAAKASGLRRVSIDLSLFTFKLAPDTGKNPGAIYVTADGEYLGKVLEGRFVRSRDCPDLLQEQVLSVCADPHAAAVAHGKKTGRCSCCGRELTDPVSVAQGIGPICAERFGW